MEPCFHLSDVALELLKGASALLITGLAAVIALFAYFRQKEYELVQVRYLEGGVDVLAAHLAKAAGTVSHNYARCLQITKAFRDMKELFDIKELQNGFITFDASEFLEIAHFRVRQLLGSTIAWEIFQSVMAYWGNANAKIADEIPQAMRIKCTTSEINKTHADMAEIIASELRELHEGGFKYATLLHEMNVLGALLETQKLSFSGVYRFRKDRQVVALLSRLRAAFPEETQSETTP